MSKPVKSAKKTRKSKFRNTRLFKLLRILLIIIFIVILVNIISSISHKPPENITLVIGENKIDLKNKIILENNSTFYLSIDDISNLYDSNIYYSNNIVITTYNKHIAVLEIDKNTMSVNDVVQEISGTLKQKGGTVYIPFSDMKDVYDFEYSYNKDTKTLIVDSLSNEKQEAIVYKNCKLKEETKFGAKSLEKLKKSDYVTVFATERKIFKS